MQTIIKIKDGNAEISVPENEKILGKIPLFNPSMKFNPDYSNIFFLT